MPEDYNEQAQLRTYDLLHTCSACSRVRVRVLGLRACVRVFGLSARVRVYGLRARAREAGSG